jgi:hypothetical protein
VTCLAEPSSIRAGFLASIHGVNSGDRFSGGRGCGLILWVTAGVTYLPPAFSGLSMGPCRGFGLAGWPVQAARMR